MKCRPLTYPFNDILLCRQGDLPFGENRVLHWERLDENFAPAPGGTVVFIETKQGGPMRFSAREVIQAFGQQYNLTAREIDIVNFLLNGFPNELIADRLGISVGTVRNHRWRLYYKLDITAERELYSLLLSTMLDMPSIEREYLRTKPALP